LIITLSRSYTTRR